MAVSRASQNLSSVMRLKVTTMRISLSTSSPRIAAEDRDFLIHLCCCLLGHGCETALLTAPAAAPTALCRSQHARHGEHRRAGDRLQRTFKNVPFVAQRGRRLAALRGQLLHQLVCIRIHADRVHCRATMPYIAALADHQIDGGASSSGATGAATWE